ncbi:ABC transporter permease [Novimethylophilus kurashikiensis]
MAEGAGGVMRALRNIYRLGLKELASLRYDTVLVVLIVYFFSYAVYAPAKGTQMELINASVAVVDEDRSVLSQRIFDALLPPHFLPPQHLEASQIDRAMERGKYTFIVDIPPDFEADVMRGRKPVIQVNVDATAMIQAGSGAGHLQSVIAQEILAFTHTKVDTPVNLVLRSQYNPNRESVWFVALMQVVNNITLLAIFLTGAALIREREHGTIEHLLVMPLTPAEIMLAKIWANGLVVVVAASLSLELMVRGVLGVPIAGSLLLFISGEVIYLFSVTALGIFLATLARSMPQFALLAMPVFIVMNLLSGSNTPFESMPAAVQHIMRFSPSTHFVSLSQAILFRGAGIDVVWPEFLATAGLGVVFFFGALLRFRKTISQMQA